MIGKLLLFFKKFGAYQLEGITSKIEYRRAQVFNFSILIECVILFINSIRHFARGSYSSSIIVTITLFFFLFLYSTSFIKRTTKYAILIATGIVVTFFFTHFIDRSRDIIQVYLAVLVATGLFLSGRQFYVLFFSTILVYYFTFFNLGYHQIYNPLGSFTFIALTIMMRLFVMDAENNEKIIDRQVKELEEVDKQKTRLFSNISHEIRTPLTLIQGANEQLHEIKENQKLTSVITNNSNRMLELVNQILELSKIEANQRKITLTEVVFSDFLSSIIQSFDILSIQKEINFTYSIAQLDKSVFVDIDALSKIIVNLLSNAFKFSDKKDCIKLNIRLNEKNLLEINVIDTGKGISEEKLPYIFNQYYHSNVGLEASSGIGLALVKELVSLLEGTISVQSKINSGSTFMVELPCYVEQFVNVEKNQMEIIPMTKSINELTSIDDNKVGLVPENTENEQEILLVVEDNPELRAFISEVTGAQFKVIEAKDGVEGLAMAKRHIPDIILSDVMMPNMNGFEMLEALKNEVITSHIPVLLLTAKADEQDVLTGLQLQADDYILKPFSKKELLLRLLNKITYRNKVRNQYQNNFSPIDKPNNLLSIEDKFLKKLQEIIKENLSNSDFSSEDLAKEAGLSSSQLFRKLKALTNISASIYMRNIRLEEAKILMQKGEANISEIAYDTGFSSINYFSKCFKEYTGIAPK